MKANSFSDVIFAVLLEVLKWGSWHQIRRLIIVALSIAMVNMRRRCHVTADNAMLVGLHV